MRTILRSVTVIAITSCAAVTTSCQKEENLETYAQHSIVGTWMTSGMEGFTVSGLMISFSADNTCKARIEGVVREEYTGTYSIDYDRHSLSYDFGQSPRVFKFTMSENGRKMTLADTGSELKGIWTRRSYN